MEQHGDRAGHVLSRSRPRIRSHPTHVVTYLVTSQTRMLRSAHDATTCPRGAGQTTRIFDRGFRLGYFTRTFDSDFQLGYLTQKNDSDMPYMRLGYSRDFPLGQQPASCVARAAL